MARSLPQRLKGFLSRRAGVKKSHFFQQNPREISAARASVVRLAAAAAPQQQIISVQQDKHGAQILSLATAGFSGKKEFMVGSSDHADVQVVSPNVEESHAKLELQNGRLYCTALLGDYGAGDLNSYTWIDGVQILGRVPYLVAPGTMLAFGEASCSFVTSFKEKVEMTWMLESIINDWASKACAESRLKFEEAFKDE